MTEHLSLLDFEVIGTTGSLLAGPVMPWHTPFPSTKAIVSLKIPNTKGHVAIHKVRIWHGGIGLSHVEIRHVSRKQVAVVLPRSQAVSMYEHKLAQHNAMRTSSLTTSSETTSHVTTDLLSPTRGGIIPADSVTTTTSSEFNIPVGGMGINVVGDEGEGAVVMLLLYNVWEPVGRILVERIEIFGGPVIKLSSEEAAVVSTVPTSTYTLKTMEKLQSPPPPKPVVKATHPPTPPPIPPPTLSHVPPPTVPSTPLSPYPFHGVGIVLSGFENPLRGQLKTKAIDLGAVVLPDWDVSKGSTHLICAYPNTPKYVQVKASNQKMKQSGGGGPVGHIVTKEWILKSHERKQRLPETAFLLEDDEDLHYAKKTRYRMRMQK